MLVKLKIHNYFLNYAEMNLSIMLQEKKKNLRGNNKPFMTKALFKSIMKRTRLRKTFLKNPVVANKLVYTHTKRNFCVSLLRKVKREYFANLNEINIFITDNRKF